MGDLNGGLGGIVLMSEGFTSDVPRARERRLPDLQGLVRAASRFRVLLYAFDPGAVPSPPTDSASTDADPVAESSAVLQSLARQTGGDALTAGQDLAPAFQRVSSDLDSYYVLTFTSTNPNDGRFHSVQVTSKRRGAQVRYSLRLLGAASERAAGDTPSACRRCCRRGRSVAARSSTPGSA